MTKIDFKKYRKMAQPPEIFLRVGHEKWYGLWIRRISIRVSWILAHFSKISPNDVTVFMLVWGIPASLIIFIPGIWGIIAFFLWQQIWTLLDSIDGELARYKKQFSNSGVYLDGIAHAVGITFLFLAIGFKFYEIEPNLSYIILGSVASVLILLNRAVYMTFNYHSKIIKTSFGGVAKENFLVKIAVELMGQIEISMLATVGLLLFSYYTWPSVPYVFFWAYIVLNLAAFYLSVNRHSRALNKAGS